MKLLFNTLIILLVILSGCKSEERLQNKALTDIEPLKNGYIKDSVWREAGDTTQLRQVIEQSNLSMVLLLNKHTLEGLDTELAFQAIGKIYVDDITPLILCKGKDFDWVRLQLADTVRLPMVVFLKHGSITHEIYIDANEGDGFSKSIALITKRIKEEVELDKRYKKRGML